MLEPISLSVCVANLKTGIIRNEEIFILSFYHSMMRKRGVLHAFLQVRKKGTGKDGSIGSALACGSIDPSLNPDEGEFILTKRIILLVTTISLHKFLNLKLRVCNEQVLVAVYE